MLNVTATENGDDHGWVGDSKLQIPTGKKVVADHVSGSPTVSAPEGYVYDYNYTEVGDLESLNTELAKTYSCIKLTSNLELTEALTVTNDSYINLNGNTVTYTNSENSYAITADGAGTYLQIVGGTIKSDKEGLRANHGATLDLDLTLETVQCGVAAQRSSSLLIRGGDYTATNNGVIMTNDTVKTDDDLGHNDIVINGGTFNAKIETTGEIACGIYVANSDTVTVNAGTFNIEDGVGIVARSGSTYVADAVEFHHAKKDGRTLEEGIVGDAEQPILPVGKDIVLDLVAKYPGGTPSVDDAAHDLYVVANEADKVKTEEALLEKVTAGGPVVLAVDIQLSKAIDIKKSLKFYGNGHSVTATTGVDRVFNVNKIADDLNITFTDTKIACPSSGAYGRGISLHDNTGTIKLAFNDCEVTADHYPVNVGDGNADVEINVRKSTLNGYCAAQTHSANTKWTFEDCTLNGINNFEKSDWNDFAMFKVNVGACNTILNFKNCHIEASSSTGNEENFVSVWAYSELTFTGCTFKHNDEEVASTLEAVDQYIYGADHYKLTVE